MLRGKKHTHKCKVEGCEASYHAKDYCSKHYEHLGRPLKPGERVKKWRQANPEKRRAQKMRNHYKNRDSKIAKMKAWNEANQDYIKQRRKDDYAALDKTTPKYRYAHLKSKSSFRKFQLGFTEDQFTNWANARDYKCHYCNNEIKGTGYSLDRLDSKKDYLLDNIVNCCKYCNYAKTNMTVDEFKNHILRIYEHFCKE